MVVVIEDITDQEPTTPEAPPKDDESRRAKNIKELETNDLEDEESPQDQEQAGGRGMESSGNLVGPSQSLIKISRMCLCRMP